MEHDALGVRTKLVLHVDTMFVQCLSFLICVTKPLGLLTCIFFADGRGEFSVKRTISALLCALRERNFVLTSLLSDGEGAKALCAAVIRSLGVRFNPRPGGF